MEREANYAAVGAFVLLVVAMAVLFVYWYSDSVDPRDYTRYEVYFDGSVSGLTRAARCATSASMSVASSRCASTGARAPGCR